MKQEAELRELIYLAMESMIVAISIIDTKGILLYYNKHAAEILDRKSKYIGQNIYSHHKKSSSSKKLESMIQEFQNGRVEPFHYEAMPYGETIKVTLSPILENGKLIGCVQSVLLKEDIDSK
jgi:sensor histidine kinase regulating citrate/malate metabolism